jgi:hypothetical protein
LPIAQNNPEHKKRQRTAANVYQYPIGLEEATIAAGTASRGNDKFTNSNNQLIDAYHNQKA